MYDDVEQLAVFAFKSLTTEYHWELYSKQNVKQFIRKNKLLEENHQYLTIIILRCLDEDIGRRMPIDEVLYYLEEGIKNE